MSVQPYTVNELDKPSRSIAVITGMPGKHRAVTTLMTYQRPRTNYRPRHGKDDT